MNFRFIRDHAGRLLSKIADCLLDAPGVSINKAAGENLLLLQTVLETEVRQ